MAKEKDLSEKKRWRGSEAMERVGRKPERCGLRPRIHRRFDLFSPALADIMDWSFRFPQGFGMACSVDL